MSVRISGPKKKVFLAEVSDELNRIQLKFKKFKSYKKKRENFEKIGKIVKTENGFKHRPVSRLGTLARGL